MNGSPKVIEALNNVYQVLWRTEHQAHLQEHCYECQGWSSSKWWDDIENNIHKECTHFILNRINELGGMVDGSGGEGVTYFADDFKKAIDTTLGMLNSCREAYGALCEVAEADNDYGTISMSWKHICWIECHIVKFESHALQLAKLGAVVMTGAL